ncbi:MAG: CAP domain-containing protein [Patescibacteria group bacterium]
MSGGPNKKSIFTYITLAVLGIAGGLAFLLKNKNMQKRIVKMRKKIGKKLTKAERAVPDEYPFGKRVIHTLKDYIVPHDGNNHHPKALRPKALTTYVVAILIVKIFVTASLFFLYPNTGYVNSKISDDLYALTNQARLEAGLEQLQINEHLVSAARSKTEHMIAEGYFSHISPDGRKPWQFIDTTQYSFSHMGENLAMDFSSADVVHSAFMNSPTHRDNILHKEYTEVGMAVLVGDLFGRETIVLAQFFGKEQFTNTLAIANNLEEPTEPVLPVDTDTEQVVVVEQPIEEPVTNPKEPQVEDLIVETSTIVTSTDPITEPSQITEATLDSATTSTSTIASVEGIEFYPSAQLIVTEQVAVEKGLVDLLVSWARNFMTLMLIIVSLLLLVNILVEHRVQHSHVIAHSLLVIFFIITMIFTRLHFLEHFVVY